MLQSRPVRSYPNSPPSGRNVRRRCSGILSKSARAMPPEAGRRYLAEMQRLTLGFHEQIEQSMSHPVDHAHGHH